MDPRECLAASTSLDATGFHPRDPHAATGRFWDVWMIQFSGEEGYGIESSFAEDLGHFLPQVLPLVDGKSIAGGLDCCSTVWPHVFVANIVKYVDNLDRCAWLGASALLSPPCSRTAAFQVCCWFGRCLDAGWRQGCSCM